MGDGIAAEPLVRPGSGEQGSGRVTGSQVAYRGHGVDTDRDGADRGLGFAEPDEPRIEDDITTVEGARLAKPESRAEQEPDDGLAPVAGNGIADGVGLVSGERVDGLADDPRELDPGGRVVGDAAIVDGFLE